jgi:hypothetical protein
MTDKTMRVQRNKMKLKLGLTQRNSLPSARSKMIDLVGQRQVGESVTVVGEKHFFMGILRLALRRWPIEDTGISEGNVPIVNVAMEQLSFLPLGENKIVGNTFVVVQKVFDEIRPVSQAQNEIFMAVMRVVFHYVPDDRPIPDVYHGFGDRLRKLAHSQALPSAKENHFHDNPPYGRTTI